MKIYIISLQEIRSRDQSDKPPTVVKCQDEMLALYYCWMFQHLGTIEQGFYYSSPRHIFLHIETLAGALLLLGISTPRYNRTRVVPVHLPRYIFLRIETLVLYYCWLYLPLGTIEQGFQFTQTYFLCIETLAVYNCLLFLPLGTTEQGFQFTQTYFYIFFYIYRNSDNPDLANWRFSSPFYCTQTQKQPTLVNRQ